MKACSRRTVFAVFMGLILFGWSGSFPTALAEQIDVVSPESVGMSKERLANIDSIVEKAVKEKQVKGMVVLVARHGKIAYFKAFGEMYESRPMERDAVFRWASMTKTVTVAAFMQFWDRGKFQLKDPVSKYIPEFKDLQVAEMGEEDQIKLVPAKRQVTIHDLLAFTGGFSATYMAGLGPIHKYVAEKYAERGVQDLATEHYTKPLKENVKLIAKCPLAFHPGEAWGYNQVSLDIAAYLVEVFSGKPFNRYIREDLFGPLGSDEVWFYPPESVFPRIPAVYNNPGKLVELTKSWTMGTGTIGPNYTFSKNKAYFGAATSLHGTTYDYYKFAQMLLNKGEYNGARVLSRQAVETMTTVQVGEGPQYRNIFSGTTGWGYGVDIQETAKMNSLSDWYGGPGSYGWRGFWSTMFFNDPVDDTVVLTMAQTPRHGYPLGLRINVAAGASIVE